MWLALVDVQVDGMRFGTRVRPLSITALPEAEECVVSVTEISARNRLLSSLQNYMAALLLQITREAIGYNPAFSLPPLKYSTGFGYYGALNRPLDV